MTVRVNVSAAVLQWAQESSSLATEDIAARFPRWPEWLDGSTGPTLNQLEQLATLTGIPFGYLLLSDPPALTLPLADFREGFADLHFIAHQPIVEVLEILAGIYRCGTLVVLQALRRDGLIEFADFSATYEAEMNRLSTLGADRGSGGDHYRNQPFRVGDRLSRAVMADALEGKTPIAEAMQLISMKSLNSFDEYARQLGVA